MPEPKPKTLTTGVRGTDNCPVCGRTMRRSKQDICGTVLVCLTCARGVHRVQILLGGINEDVR